MIIEIEPSEVKMRKLEKMMKVEKTNRAQSNKTAFNDET